MSTSFIRSNNRTFLPTNPLISYISTLLHPLIKHQYLSLTMPPSFPPNPISISPSKLRSDVYGFSCEDEPSTPLVISVLASLVERTIARNERVVRKCSIVAVKDARSRAFYSPQVLDMSIQSFLERFFRYARVAPPVYVVAYVYMDRLCRSNPGLKVCLMNVHRLLITSIMVASKFVEDRNYRNSYFAKVGGISTMELNNLELNFLFLMKFKLHVSVSVFESYCSHLEREVSFGGGYHIERSLKCMCGGESTSGEIFWKIRYKGFTVNQFQDLRDALPNSVMLLVAKNTLVGKVIEGTPWEALKACRKGMDAWDFIHTEKIPQALKPYLSFQKERKLDDNDFMGAVFEGKFYGPDEFKVLETMPSRAKIYAKLLDRGLLLERKMAKYPEKPEWNRVPRPWQVEEIMEEEDGLADGAGGERPAVSDAEQPNR